MKLLQKKYEIKKENCYKIHLMQLKKKKTCHKEYKKLDRMIHFNISEYF